MLATLGVAIVVGPLAAVAGAVSSNVAIAAQLVSQSSGNPLVELSATAFGSAGTPSSGTITFYEDSVAISSCTAVAIDGSGNATCDLSASTLGTSTHKFYASYSGGGSYGGASSKTISYSVASVSVGISTAATTTTATTTTTPPISAPSAPVSVDATANADPSLVNSALVSWGSPTNDGGSPLTSYTVITNDAATGTPVAYFETTNSTTSLVVSDLSSGYGYSFSVVAHNLAGSSPISSTSNIVVPVAVAPSSSSNGSSTTATGTATASASTSSGVTATNTIKATAQGAGTVIVAVYPSNPVPGLNAAGTFFDVAVTGSSAFSVVNFTVCHVPSGARVQWWNAVAGLLGTVSDETSLGSDGCVQVTVTNSTSPTLSELYGTVFIVPSTASNSASSTGPTKTPSYRGFLYVTANGQVTAVAGAKAHGSVKAAKLRGTHVVALARNASGKGYWVVSAKGTVFAFGNAHAYGNAKTSAATGPVVALVPTSSGRGYWIATSKGGVFAFGNAVERGSLLREARKPSASIVALATSSKQTGYWLLARNGAVYRFGSAGNYGSILTRHLHPDGALVALRPTSNGRGYWIASTKGAVYAFGDAHGHGTLPSRHMTPATPIVALAPTGNGGGYWLFARNGAAYSFGNARILPALTASSKRKIVAVGI